MVMIAANRKLKEVWMVDGRVERACIRVEYDAMMIGGNGGKSDSAGIGTDCDGFEGW
jgi:hypothetical protein